MRTVHSLSAETTLPALSHVPKLASLTLDLCVLPNLFPHTYDQPMSAFCICINQTQCRFMGLDELAFKPPTDGGWHSNDRESWIRQIQALTSSPPSGHADGATAPPSADTSSAVGQRASSVDDTEEQVTLQQLQCQLQQVKERAEASEKRIICQICCERICNAVVMPCLHFYYCDECIDQHFARCDIAKCPLCRTPVQGVLQLRQGQ
jgi:hypothetical protein